MKLLPGERLPGSGPPHQPGGYLVTEVIGETPWAGLYGARKVCYNFDFTAKRPRETDEKEWLDVLLRTVNYPRLDSLEYVTGRRALARAEGTAILANRGSNLWPEPLDLLELTNTRDPFTFARGPTRTVLGSSGPLAREPVVVLARPHGDPLARWLHTDPPTAALLSVIAELLEFVHSAHADGLLLNSLSPSTLLVDRAGRMHYLGTDAVVPLAPPPSLPSPHGWGRVGVGDWRPFFPPERYPRGYSGPECFDPTAPRDRRTDLYAWAAIAYHVLTNDRPVQIALEQGQPWTRFGDPQLMRLQQALTAIPHGHVRNWAEQLGVNADVLLAGWPHNLVTALRLCLSPEPGQRPPSVADLRVWLIAPPPAPPLAALALRLPRSDTVRLFCHAPEAGPDVDVLVRRGAGTYPTTPEEGQPIAEMAPGSWAEDTCPRVPCPTGSPDDLFNPAGDAARYAFFARRRHASGAICSTATPAYLLEPYPSTIRRLAEAGTEPSSSEEPEPPRVALLFHALDTARTAETLLQSPLPQVRGWALRRMTGARRLAGASPSLETLLLRTLQDPVQGLRLEAVKGLLAGLAPPAERLAGRVFEILAAVFPKDCAPAARALRAAGVREELLRLALAAVNQDLPAACPVCAIELPDRDVPAHLAATHGYLEVAGELLSRAEALARLWERVFRAGDTAAHDRLGELVLVAGGEGEYLAALEAEVAHRAGDLLASDGSGLARLASCVRPHRAGWPLLPGLLRSSNPQVREVGRALLLPELGDRLAGEKLSVTELRRQLGQVCPPDLIDEMILLCQGLAPLGVASAVVEECLQALQAERPVKCSECGQPIAQGECDAHLRRVHQVYEYGGQRRSFEETMGVLLEALSGASPDFEAWVALERATRDVYGEQADAMLASWLAQKLLAVQPVERGQVAGAMAEAVVRGDRSAHLVPALLAAGTGSVVQAAGALLALECVARLPAPLPEAAVEAVKPLLADKRLPREAREAATAALLRTTGKSGAAAVDVLRAFAATGNKAVAIERLQRLEGRVGQAEAIDALRTELEDQVRMSCPRCRVELLRPEMVEHLWDHHRLVLDGRRVREPWRVIEDWVADYKLEKDPEVLARCQALASRLDPRDGSRQLGRLLLRQGIEDAQALRERGKEARQKGASICPRCYALVPPPAYEPPGAMYVRKRGLSAGGYRVELRDGGLAPRLEVRAPGGWIYRGREPGSRWTRKGALLLWAGPLLLAAGVLAFVELPLDLSSLWSGLEPGSQRWVPAAGVGGLGLLVALLVLLLWPAPRDPRQRAVNHAWTILVPRLHREGFNAEGLAFVAGLAEASRERGDVRARAASLRDAIEAAQEAAGADPGLGLCAGLVARLEAEDRARGGEDPVPLLAERLVGCVQGDLPLGFATGLLGPREGPAWTELERRRLRVLLCARAFEAGLGADDLIESSRACDALGLVLGQLDAEAVARLRLLWSLSDERPWEKVGKAATVFDLAEAPAAGEEALTEYPDLLLAPAGDEGLYLTARGVCLAGAHLTEEPARVERVRRERGGEEAFVVVAGRQRFRFEDDPGDLAERLEGWLRWYFRSFLPELPAARAAPAPEAAGKRRARQAVACPECGAALLPCVGAVGIAVENV